MADEETMKALKAQFEIEDSSSSSSQSDSKTTLQSDETLKEGLPGDSKAL